jgi:hypothetical protein
MSRARDMADAGKVINYLDDASSKIQTQIEAASAAAVAASTAASNAAVAAESSGGNRFSTKAISENTTLDADTIYLVGKSLTIMAGVILTIPVSSLLEFRLYSAGKAL